MPLSSGQILNNRYRIVKLLGQGGFGAVYRAWDTNLDGPVALKESTEASTAAQKQFQLEAKLLFRLVHPNLPRVHDCFVIPGHGSYLAMDYVEGEDLQEKLDKVGGPLPEALVLHWISQVCDALSYLHGQNPAVIHRDIKPANIKISPEGKAMLVDFGIAKVYDPNFHTTMGARAHTSGYSPPEQYGRGVTDAQSDVYALGATLYHLLTGQVPPDSMDMISGGVPQPISVRALNPAVSPAASAAVEKAMRLERKERWKSVQAFKTAFNPNQAPNLGTGATVPVMPIGRTQVASAAIASSKSLPINRRLPWIWIGVVSLLGLAVVSLIIRELAVVYRRTEFSPTQTANDFAIAVTRPVHLATPDFSVTQTSQSRAEAATGQVELATIAPTSDDISISILTPTGEYRLTSTLSLPQLIVDAHSVKMALIPAGDFQMGSENGNGDEKPVHTVYLDAFYMDVYEVTNAHYAMCVYAGACIEPGDKSSSTQTSYYANSKYDGYPVIYVDWAQAKTYCEWRGTELPTEAQWEKAARGGLEGKTYPWGDESLDCSKANYRGKNSYCIGDTTAVGSYNPNGYGLYDMTGNVWEWVNDWYQSNYYTLSPSRNPPGPATGTDRALRGGGWDLIGGNLRVAYRNYYYPGSRRFNFGFRCATLP